ncbi:unnamed protein product [Pseudo-nitzschia multistriata]|uniref:SBF1/SBF2 domain-containing protein n=1 Tax=Pseudo-nitzschia multistriata TaxID=183589 RepID=A0A448ZN32_9STRA|nr:unnamed protein product [Pseudo-nitzschia multistriata]
MMRRFLRKGSNELDPNPIESSNGTSSLNESGPIPDRNGESRMVSGADVSPTKTKKTRKTKNVHSLPATPVSASTEREIHAQRLQKVIAKTMMDSGEGLKSFYSCIEASDALASTSTSSGRGIDDSTGLTDCSVLVSPDGELLIIPQQQQQYSKEGRANDSEESHDKEVDGEGMPAEPKRKEKSHSWFDAHGTASNELGEEYNSAVFLGNDLHKEGDKNLNGFSAKGWSTAATSLALKQSADLMGDFADFMEQLVQTKSPSTAQEKRPIDKLRSMIGEKQTELTESEVATYQHYLDKNFSAEQEKQRKFLRKKVKDQQQNIVLEVSRDRVGPLNSSGGTIPAALQALETYYSRVEESDARLWGNFSKRSGALTKIQNTTKKTEERVNGRQLALQETMMRIKVMEDYLRECKEDAKNKWDNVHQTEVKITALVEEKMMKHNKMKEEQRMQRMEEEVERTSSDDGNSAATSSEIWDLVSAATASIEEGSFEPVVDLSNDSLPTVADNESTSDTNADESQNAFEVSEEMEMEMDTRYEFEVQYRLPELRIVALAAEEAVEGAADSLLSVLSNFDRTNRSAHLSAETCLVSCGNTQATCLRSIVATERESLKERLKLLEELENKVDEIDVRADLDEYISVDKTKPGGRSSLGEDDDGGVASALNHLRGDLGSENNGNWDQESSIDDDNAGVEDDDSEITPQFIEEKLECFFRNEPLLLSDARKSDSATTIQEDFEATILELCKIAGGKSQKSTTRRSTMCYAMNAKRCSNPRIPSRAQFDGLCRVFAAVLSGCSTKTDGGLSSAILLMSLSEHFYAREKDSTAAREDTSSKKVFVKSSLVGHPLWEKDEFWDRAFHHTIMEKLNYIGVMSNFERESEKIVTLENKERSQWTENKKTKWYDLTEVERLEAASQVNAAVFAEVSTMSDSMFEFCGDLEKTSSFVRRACVKNQLPISQRSTLLRHLIRDSVAASKVVENN